MMKKGICLLLALCLLLGLSVEAFAADASERLEVLRSLQILVGDPSGDLALDRSVTRAEFSKMMAVASPYKDKVAPSSGASVFSDVKSEHWASGYIQLAVEQGWFIGYVDGTFRPDRNITLEEGCTALLRLLGYDTAQLVGAYPAAQLGKAETVGLRKNLSLGRGEILSRRDCVELFYNLLVSEDATGTVYARKLGYSAENGEVDYREAVKTDRKGPFVAENGAASLPFNGQNVTLYCNGLPCTLEDVQENDVYYYHEGLRTIWLYRDRTSGTLTAVSPSRADPSAVTVAGNSYSLGDAEAIRAVSAEGTIRVGDRVTLLLDMDGKVVRVLPVVQSVVYGMVTSSSRGIPDDVSDAGGDEIVTTRVICTDGVERSYYHRGYVQTTGKLVAVTVGEEGTSVDTLQERGIAGTFHQSAAQFGNERLASDVRILDTDENGNYAKVYPAQLAGAYLRADAVRFYTKNAAGEITDMILKEATGNTWDYAYLSEANVSALSEIKTYTYYQNGKAVKLSGTTTYPVSVGGIAIRKKDGVVSLMKPLASGKVTRIAGQTVSLQDRQLVVDDDVQVLIRDRQYGEIYIASTLAAVTNGNYEVTAWYDDFGCPAGGKVRVLTAVEKS